MRCAIVLALACASFADALSMKVKKPGNKLLETSVEASEGCRTFDMKAKAEDVEKAEKVGSSCDCKMYTASAQMQVPLCYAPGAKSQGCYRQCCGGIPYEPLTLAQKEQGTKPLGYEGNRARFRSKLLQATEGEPLKIVVVGGSMTEGTGLTDKSKRWTSELERRLQAKLGNKVVVLNRAVPASTSMTPLLHLEDIIQDKPDVVLVDYAINDAVSDAGLKAKPGDTKKSTRFAQVTNTLARTLLNLPSEPAVAYLETFTHSSLFGYDCKTSVKEFPHWDTVKYLDVPVVSYTEAACEPGVETKKIWDMSAYTQNDGPQHPKEAVHKRLGALMAHFILDNTKQACKAGKETGMQLKVKMSAEKSQLVKCASETKTKLDPLFDQKKQKWMLNQNMYNFKQKAAMKNFPAAKNDAWQFYDDRANEGWFEGMPKYGWIAKGKKGTIEFNVETSDKEHSSVIMEYLTSYDSPKQAMGKATCWFDDDKDSSLTVDSKVEQKMSLTDVVVIPVPKGTNAGSHRLKCQSDGNKFKIVSLRSC